MCVCMSSSVCVCVCGREAEQEKGGFALAWLRRPDLREEVGEKNSTAQKIDPGAALLSLFQTPESSSPGN